MRSESADVRRLFWANHKKGAAYGKFRVRLLIFFFYVNALDDHLTLWYRSAKNKNKLSLLFLMFLFVCFNRKIRSGNFTVIYCCMKGAIHFTPNFASDIHYALRELRITTSPQREIQN